MGEITNIKEEKIKNYVAMTENPYCFFSGETKVTLCFSDNERTIEEQLKRYIRSVISL